MRAWLFICLQWWSLREASIDQNQVFPRLQKQMGDEETFRVDCAEEEVWTLAFFGAEPLAALLPWNKKREKIKWRSMKAITINHEVR